MEKQLTFKVFAEVLGICRLDKNSQVPIWAEGEFVAITRTLQELSIVCSQKNIPEHVACEPGWRLLAIDGPMDLSMVGILASVSGTLASRGIAIFAISTYDTDYLLVKEHELDKALDALTQAGHRVK